MEESIKILSNKLYFKFSLHLYDMLLDVNYFAQAVINLNVGVYYD